MLQFTELVDLLFSCHILAISLLKGNKLWGGNGELSEGINELTFRPVHTGASEQESSFQQGRRYACSLGLIWVLLTPQLKGQRFQSKINQMLWTRYVHKTCSCSHQFCEEVYLKIYNFPQCKLTATRKKQVF